MLDPSVIWITWYPADFLQYQTQSSVPDKITHVPCTQAPGKNDLDVAESRHTSCFAAYCSCRELSYASASRRCSCSTFTAAGRRLYPIFLRCFYKRTTFRDAMTVGTPRMSAKEIMGAAQNLCPSVSSSALGCH